MVSNPRGLFEAVLLWTSEADSLDGAGSTFEGGRGWLSQLNVRW